MTLCFTPEHLGIEQHYTSPPRNPQDFADFAAWAVARYAPGRNKTTEVTTQAEQSPNFSNQFIDVSVGAQ